MGLGFLYPCLNLYDPEVEAQALLWRMADAAGPKRQLEGTQAPKMQLELEERGGLLLGAGFLPALASGLLLLRLGRLAPPREPRASVLAALALPARKWEREDEDDESMSELSEEAPACPGMSVCKHVWFV